MGVDETGEEKTMGFQVTTILFYFIWVLNTGTYLLCELSLKKKKRFIHERHREREAETQAEGEAGSMQETRRRTRSRDSGITPWAEGGC